MRFNEFHTIIIIDIGFVHTRLYIVKRKSKKKKTNFALYIICAILYDITNYMIIEGQCKIFTNKTYINIYI